MIRPNSPKSPIYRSLRKFFCLLSLVTIFSCSHSPVEKKVVTTDPWEVPKYSEEEVIRTVSSEPVCRYSCALENSFWGKSLKKKTSHTVWQVVSTPGEQGCHCQSIQKVARSYGCPASEVGQKAIIKLACK